MVQPCPECFQVQHKLSCEIGKRQRVARRRNEEDRAAIAYGFDVPASSLDPVDSGCPPTSDGGAAAQCGGGE